MASEEGIGVRFHPDSYCESVMFGVMLDCIKKEKTEILCESIRVTAADIEAIKKYMCNEFNTVVADHREVLAMSPNGVFPKYCCIHIASIDRNDIPRIMLYGTAAFIEKTKADVYAFSSHVGATINWVYDKYMNSIEIPLNTARMPADAMYPFVEKPLKEYYDSFYKSSANVLICIGEPGTGKTTFLRGMLASLNISAMLSYDASTFDSDQFFVNFMGSSSGAMIVEDADIMLTPRTDGNSSMQRFLNAGDGLVTLPQRKLIFTTNLPNTKNIDPALVRSGRCFDVLRFRKLAPAEIASLCADMRIQMRPEFNEPQTLAYVMNRG